VIGIEKPSLYAAFGSKEDLFFKAVERYKARLTGAVSEAFTLPSARAGLEAYLCELASFQSSPGQPQGCLFVQGALVASEESKRVSDALCGIRKEGLALIRSFLERGLKLGELPPDTDIDAMALFYNAISHGISVQAAGGVSTKDLHRTISLAMGQWRESKPVSKGFQKRGHTSPRSARKPARRAK